ncbi:hypothetical protein BDW62DRAFT_197091 [Aspergillus aurantiobrunneus]
MAYSALSAEIILYIGDSFHSDLDPVDPDHDFDFSSLNSWIRTSKWHASLLTPTLYDKALDFNPRNTQRSCERRMTMGGRGPHGETMGNRTGLEIGIYGRLPPQ